MSRAVSVFRQCFRLAPDLSLPQDGEFRLLSGAQVSGLAPPKRERWELVVEVLVCGWLDLLVRRRVGGVRQMFCRLAVANKDTAYTLLRPLWPQGIWDMDVGNGPQNSQV